MYVTDTVFHHHALSGPVIIKTTNQFAEYPDSIVQNIPVIYLPEIQHHTEHRENSVYKKVLVDFVEQFVLEDRVSH